MEKWKLGHTGAAQHEFEAWRKDDNTRRFHGSFPLKRVQYPCKRLAQERTDLMLLVDLTERMLLALVGLAQRRVLEVSLLRRPSHKGSGLDMSGRLVTAAFAFLLGLANNSSTPHPRFFPLTLPAVFVPLGSRVS